MRIIFSKNCRNSQSRLHLQSLAPMTVGFCKTMCARYLTTHTRKPFVVFATSATPHKHDFRKPDNKENTRLSHSQRNGDSKHAAG